MTEVLNLKPGTHVLDFRAIRVLSARFYSKQCEHPDTQVSLHRGRIATNQTFDTATGLNTAATTANDFTKQVFGDGSTGLSPVDRWTLALPLAENPCLLSVSASDSAEFNGGEFGDALLNLEFVSTG